MLSFDVYIDNRPAPQLDLTGAYVVGSDDVPLRAEIEFKEGIISCTKRAAGPAGLALLWETPEIGRTLTETVRLQERKQPYILQLELARGRLLRINQKLEDWGLLLEQTQHKKIFAQIHQARDTLIKSLQAETTDKAAELGQQALAQAIRASEVIAEYVAETDLAARRKAAEMPRRPLGCRIETDQPVELAGQRIAPLFDFATVPLGWRDIEPNEQTFQWKPIDAWVEALVRERIPIKGSPLLSFAEGCVPDWLYIWEHDFDTIRDLAFEHLRRVINRYGQHVQSWDVISGIHAANCFQFNFEQIMELTRMSAAVVKQTAPRSQAIIELTEPWGEYYARNQRTIPPLLFADMVMQSGIQFDGFGVRILLGGGREGTLARDLFQVSALLDSYIRLGKPVHVTAVQVPSQAGRAGTSGASSFWHRPWDEQVQAEWARKLVTMALSKDGVESVTWHSLVDQPEHAVPYGGLLRSDLAPKRVYQELVDLRGKMLGPKRGRRAAL